MHLASAVVIGGVILILAVTGVTLAYEGQFMERAERAYFVDVSSDESRLTIEALVDAAERLRPPEVDEGFRATAVVVRSNPRAAVRVEGGRTARVFLDPYTGELRGVGSPRLEGFFDGVRAWHRWLNVAEPSVRKGRAVTGAANLVFFFMVLSGLFLWFPRKWSRKRLRAVLLFRRGVRGRARDFNWHNVVGVWSALPLLGIIATAAVISYPDLADRVYPTVGPWVWNRGLPTLPDSGGAPGSPASPGTPTAAAAPVNLAIAAAPGDLTAAVQTAQTTVPSWRRIVLTLPSERADVISLQIDAGNPGQPHLSGTLTIDDTTGARREWRTFAHLSPERRAQEFLRYAHTGEYWGLFGQTLAGLFSIAAALLVCTGLSLAFRRLKRAYTRRVSAVRGQKL